MDFQEAIRKIEERGDFNRFAEVKPIFDDRLAELKPGDHTGRAICYYYILVSYLKANLVHETEESVEFYERMDEAFTKQEEVYREDKDKFSWSEIADFFKLAERCYGSLEFHYFKHNFRKRQLLAYQQKMRFRKDSHYFNKEYWKALEYKAVEITSAYGTSLWRWATTTFTFAMVMAVAYAAVDLSLSAPLQTVQNGAHWYDYIYFSIITMTTVGFGDITPIHWAPKLMATAQAFIGFLMLGIFIGMIQKKH